MLAELSPLLAEKANLTSPLSAAQLNQVLLEFSGTSVCTIHQEYCLGKNQQVSPWLRAEKLTSSIPRSTHVWSLCFQFHLESRMNWDRIRRAVATYTRIWSLSDQVCIVLILDRISCPSKLVDCRSGGGKCIPRNYIDVTTMKYFNNSFADPLALH